MEIRFKDDEHKQKYDEICRKMRYLDSYHTAVAYLLALDTACRKHIDDVFDFGGDGIKRECLHKGWQTSTSRRATHLAFNLWNGCCSDGETYTDKDGYEADLPSAEYTPDNIFCDSLAEYFFEAVKLRYPQYF